MFFTAILLAFLTGLVAIYLFVLKSHYSYFTRRNIPGPPPTLIFGHLLQRWKSPLSFQQIRDWTRQYGSIYGIFEGTRPLYIVSDVDFLQEMFIKQFSSFHSRRVIFLPRGNQNPAENLFSAQGDEWRRQRHVINPIFSTIKLKSMIPLINECIQSMMSKVQQTNGKEFDIYVLFKRLQMDITWHCMFGIDTDLQNDIDNMYMKKSVACTAIDPEKLLQVKLTLIMPFLAPLLTQVMRVRSFVQDTVRALFPSLLRKVEEPPQIWILKRVGDVVKDRLASGKKRMDLLQMMLDAAVDDKTKGQDKAKDPESKHLYYSEVLINVFLFMIAGYDTTAAALAYATYILATEKEIQEKLQAEVDEHWRENEEGGIDYSLMSDMNYMDLFWREILRMFSGSGKVRIRECNQTTVICGHVIERGSLIMPDLHSVHRNPDLWGPEDVKRCVPERHLAKRHPAAYMGFGIGPRQCVGMRFALMAIKLTLAHLVHTYNILPGEKLVECMALKEGSIITPQAVYVRLEKRSST